MDKKELMASIGHGLRAARSQRDGWTQEYAADQVGISPEFYARIERGHALPSVPTLRKLVNVFGVSADVLLSTEGVSARCVAPKS